MKVPTREEKKINDLLHIMSLNNNRIIAEVEDIQRGREHSAQDILDGIEYVLEERFADMIRSETESES